MSRLVLSSILNKGEQVFNGGMFNGLEYQLVTNPITGRTWLDRNLGATRVATAVNDSQAYGWLYQWGRLSDGHQIRTSTTRNEQSTTDVPGHDDFIIGFSDWRNPSNNNLWQGVNGINNPCPPGFRLPTESEFIAESVLFLAQNRTGAFESFLKIPIGGRRVGNTGVLNLVNNNAFIWTSTSITAVQATSFNAGSTFLQYINTEPKSNGYSVRPIRDQQFD